MRYRIEFVGGAKADLRALRKTDQTKVLDRIERHLTQKPTRQSKSRIRQMRPGTFPPYRLRVDQFRVYYDVVEALQLVVVLGIVPKARSAAWLEGPIDSRREAEP